MATKGCSCAVCRSPEVLAKLGLDQDGEASAAERRLAAALARRFRSPQDLYKALGIDVSGMEEGTKTMRTRYDARSRDQEEEMMSGYDRSRDGR
jgi:hypothetical protein